MRRRQPRCSGRLNVETSPTCCVALDEPALVTDAAWVAVGITEPAVAAVCRAAGFDAHAEDKLERPVAGDGLAAEVSTLAHVVRRSLRDLLDGPLPSAEAPERSGP